MSQFLASTLIKPNVMPVNNVTPVLNGASVQAKQK